MAKKTAKDSVVTLKMALKEMQLKPNEEVLVYTYGKRGSDSKPLTIENIPTKLLKKEVMLIQPHQGGIEHEYSLYKFVVI